MVQWLRLCASKAEGTGSIPDQGAKVPHAAWHSLKKKRERNLSYVFMRLTCQKDPVVMNSQRNTGNKSSRLEYFNKIKIENMIDFALFIHSLK